MNKLSHNGTDGRSYGGDPSLVHIPDHHREDIGKAVADTLTALMRAMGTLGVGHAPEPYEGDKPLCPGCYMIALFDAAVTLAQREGQPVKELGLSMAQLFTKLAQEGAYRATEEMTVICQPNARLTELRRIITEDPDLGSVSDAQEFRKELAALEAQG